MDVGPCLRDRSASKPHQILIVLNGKLYGITKNAHLIKVSMRNATLCDTTNCNDNKNIFSRFPYGIH